MKKLSVLVSAAAGVIDKAATWLLFLLLLVMTCITFAQVVTRYVFNFSITWSEELARFLFIWSIFAGIPSLIFRSGMTAFDLILGRLRGRTAKFAVLLLSAAALFFFHLMAYGSFPLVARQFAQKATSLPVPMGLIYIVIPVSGFTAMFMIVEHLLRVLGEGGETA